MNEIEIRAGATAEAVALHNGTRSNADCADWTPRPGSSESAKSAVERRSGLFPARIAISSLAVAATLVALTACNLHSKAAATGGEQHKVKVVTTLFPLYDMARFVGAGRADVTLLLPPGVEAHSWEPKPDDIVKINEADVFVYTGKFMEPWADDIIRGASNRKLIVVDASQGTKMIEGKELGVRDDSEISNIKYQMSNAPTPDPRHATPVSGGAPDPHIWLDFDNARVMVGNVTRALDSADGAHRADYERNAAGYEDSLSRLDSLYRTALAACPKKEIVYGGHYAFGYLAKRYGLKYSAAQGISPDAEPTANDLARLVDQVKKDNVKHVFYEELTSPKIAQTIANETSAKLLLLNAAHNLTREQLDRGTTFFDILEADLENLKIGLEYPTGE